MSLKRTLDRYFLLRDIRPSSERQFRAVVSVFLHWKNVDDLPADQFTGEIISEFLADRQRLGRSSHYRRSLRNALKALHRFSRDYKNCDPIRPVKVEPLEPESWSPAEVAKLVAACDELPFKDRNYWRSLIQAGYYSGLNVIDLHRLERQHIQPNGFIPFNRSKTRVRVFVAIPAELAAEILATAPDEGPIWPRKTSQEFFRRRFARLVKLAGIPDGTFKRLRKTSGTLVELAEPGRGHRHLGNGAKIFEAHYEDRRVTNAVPTMPPLLPLGGAVNE